MNEILNEAKCEAGDIILLNGLRITVKTVLSSYIMTYGGIAIEGKDQNDKYFYYKQDFDGGEYIRKSKKYIDYYGVDCTDIFKKYGY